MEKVSLLQESEINLLKSDSKGVFEKEQAEFIDIAIHDLDAPLRKLLLLVGMLNEKLAPDNEAGAYMNRIKSCAGDMRSLIDDLAVLAKLSPDKREFTSCT